jgi:hypothetical protein
MKKLERNGASFFISTTEENFRLLFQALVDSSRGVHFDERETSRRLEIIEEDINKLARVADFLTEDFIRTKGLSEDYSLLHLAAMAGLSEVVELILSSGADVDIKNTKGQTPLYCAAKSGHEGVVEVLVDHDASAFLPNYDFDYLKPEVAKALSVNSKVSPRTAKAVVEKTNTILTDCSGGN